MRLSKRMTTLILALCLTLMAGPALAAYQTLRPWDIGSEVRSMQQALKTLGFDIKVDGTYGPISETAVRTFQEMNKLQPDGIAGDQTLSLLYTLALSGGAGAGAGNTSTVYPPGGGAVTSSGRLELGSFGDEVVPLQNKLISLGFNPRRNDGVYDTGTRAAVIAYQKSVGLTADGIAGPLTLQKLYSESALGASSSSGGTVTAGNAVVATGNSGPLRFRKTPSAADSRNIIGSLPNGQTVSLIDATGIWSRIRANGIEGYVMSRYLKASAAATPTPSPGEGGSSAQPAEPPTVLSGTATVSTPNGGSVRIRASAAASGNNVLASVPNKATVQVLAVSGNWTQCTWQGRTGYIMSEFLRMADASTPAPTDDPVNEEESSSAVQGTLRMGDRDGSDKAVSKLQQRLNQLGYSLTADGIFGARTHDALVSFQQQNGLNASGIADAQTQTRLFAADAKPNQSSSSGVDISQGQIGGPSASSVKLLHWYNDVKPALKGAPTIRIYHPASGVSFNIKIYSLGRHADAEPRTLKDTQLMNAAFGAASWDTRPVYVQLPGGTWTLATMHNYPHLSGSISDNGFDGHLCIHFLRDLDETQKADPNYGMQNQKAIRKAWKSMTGIDVQ